MIRDVAEALPRERLVGVYTEEVRERGRRRGFRAVTFDGWRRNIADIGHPGPARVGRYGVDMAAIDAPPGLITVGARRTCAMHDRRRDREELVKLATATLRLVTAGLLLLVAIVASDPHRPNQAC